MISAIGVDELILLWEVFVLRRQSKRRNETKEEKKAEAKKRYFKGSVSRD
jgi:hypothetical protein